MNKPNEIKMSTTDVQLLQESISKLQKQFQAFAESQDRIEYKLSGNPLDRNDEGMIGELRLVKSEVKETKKELESFKQQVTQDKKMRKGWIAGFALATGLFWTIIQFAVNYFSNHQH